MRFYQDSYGRVAFHPCDAIAFSFGISITQYQLSWGRNLRRVAALAQGGRRFPQEKVEAEAHEK